MNARRATVSCRFITLLLLAAWFVASNHCALGLMQGAMVQEHQTCCSHQTQQPTTPAGQAPVKECCQALQGLLPATEKTVVVQPPLDLAPVWLALDAGWLSTPLEKDEHSGFETGPPGRVHSFAESVLQRSLRSHAPPVLV